MVVVASRQNGLEKRVLWATKERFLPKKFSQITAGVKTILKPNSLALPRKCTQSLTTGTCKTELTGTSTTTKKAKNSTLTKPGITPTLSLELMEMVKAKRLLTTTQGMVSTIMSMEQTKSLTITLSKSEISRGMPIVFKQQPSN